MMSLWSMVCVCAFTPRECGPQLEVQVQLLNPFDFPDSMVQLFNICDKIRAVAALLGEMLGQTTLITYKIPIEPSTRPFFVELPVYHIL